MTWQPMNEAPQDGTDILVRRVERLADGTVDAVWYAVASYWVGLWVFMSAATSQPVQLRFVPAEWMPIDDSDLYEEEDDAPSLGEAEASDAGGGSGEVDPGDPEEGGG